MNWFMEYMSAFAAAPLATLVFTLGLLVFLFITVLPAVNELFVQWFNFVDRGANKIQNKAMQFCFSRKAKGYYESNGYSLVQVKDMHGRDVSMDTDRKKYADYYAWMRNGSTINPRTQSTSGYVRPEHLMKDPETAHTVYTHPCVAIAAVLAFMSVGTTVALFVDFLLQEYFVATILFLSIVSGVLAATFGSRFVMDLTKKVNVIEAAQAKE